MIYCSFCCIYVWLDPGTYMIARFMFFYKPGVTLIPLHLLGIVPWVVISQIVKIVLPLHIIHGSMSDIWRVSTSDGRSYADNHLLQIFQWIPLAFSSWPRWWGSLHVRLLPMARCSLCGWPTTALCTLWNLRSHGLSLSPSRHRGKSLCGLRIWWWRWLNLWGGIFSSLASPFPHNLLDIEWKLGWNWMIQIWLRERTWLCRKCTCRNFRHGVGTSDRARVKNPRFESRDFAHQTLWNFRHVF